MKFKASMLTLGTAISLGGLVAATVPTPAFAACSAKMSKCGGKKMSHKASQKKAKSMKKGCCASK
ncbi:MULTISPECIES: hypothetical protein [unclassified Acidiphilium]|jgi:hypothetical protein|uniref:hypothetical protein n=1 Tax=unclassified Acidiphilium TaxID=2617493 RepID=UPI00157ACF5D|nr:MULTISPECIES: hypothetical protein [unclassified Acidiphilium]HQT62434.1 hypothetical protein [Acidiphilium sp.]